MIDDKFEFLRLQKKLRCIADVEPSRFNMEMVQYFPLILNSSYRKIT